MEQLETRKAKKPKMIELQLGGSSHTPHPPSPHRTA